MRRELTVTEEEAPAAAEGAATEAAAEETAGAGAMRGSSLLLNGPGAGARPARAGLPAVATYGTVVASAR